MDYKLVIQYEAIMDVREAFIWYEEQKNGLGFSLFEELELCYQKLSKNPQHYGMLNKWLRKMKVPGFPYLIIYEIDYDRVVVTSIWHTSKSPKY